MKYLRVNNFYRNMIFTISMACFPLSAMAAIVRTELVFYDLATASQRSYALNMLPTSSGANVTLRRDDDKFTLATNVATCFNRQASADPEGYAWLKKSQVQHDDPALMPYLNFTRDNRLRVAIKPLANAQSLLLDKDSFTVLVVDPTLMTLGTAGCQP